MTTEEERHRMYQALEQSLGRRPAATLMEHLPPVGWADVATKRDLEHVETVLRGEVARVELKIESTADRLRAEIGRDLRGYGLALITVNASITAMAVGLSQAL